MSQKKRPLTHSDDRVPTDGKLLETVTETFEYAGYHRMSLPVNLHFSAGSRIGASVLGRLRNGDKVRYALVNTASLGEEAVADFNELHKDDGKKMGRYCVGVINPGESFVSFDGEEWNDWGEAVEIIRKTGDNHYLSFDNLPVKCYLYPLAQVKEAHDLSRRIPALGGDAAIYPDCGYMLLETGE